jgi:hypothetical protein
MTQTDYINQIKKIIKDNAGYLSTDDLSLCLENALMKISKDYPLIIDVLCSGNDGSDYPLPEGWVEGFSYIQAIEYPYGNLLPEYLEEDEFIIYQNNNIKIIRFLQQIILSVESFKIFFSVPYKITAETNSLPDSLSKALVHLSSYHACQMLAAKYSQFINTEFNANNVNYQSQSEKIRKIGQDHYRIYENLIFNRLLDSSSCSDLKSIFITKSYESPITRNKTFHI